MHCVMGYLLHKCPVCKCLFVKILYIGNLVGKVEVLAYGTTD